MGFFSPTFCFYYLIIVVTKFAYKPVRKYLDKRSELLNNEKKETESLNQKAKENIFESEKKLAEVRDNASKIIDDAREKAKLEKENILKEANQEANKVKTNAYKAIEEEKSKAKQEIKEDIVDVAFTMTSKLLEREVSDEDNKKIVDDFVKELDQDNKK